MEKSADIDSRVDCGHAQYTRWGSNQLSSVGIRYAREFFKKRETFSSMKSPSVESACMNFPQRAIEYTWFRPYDFESATMTCPDNGGTFKHLLKSQKPTDAKSNETTSNSDRIGPDRFAFLGSGLIQSSASQLRRIENQALHPA